VLLATPLEAAVEPDVAAAGALEDLFEPLLELLDELAALLALASELAAEVLVDSVEPDPLPAAASAAVLPTAASLVLLVPPALLRKSVTYQPEPLSWKPAAVSCFLNAGALQWGQSCSGASEIFCSTSLANPQDSHL